MNGLMGALTGADTTLIKELAIECAAMQEKLPVQKHFQEFAQDADWWIETTQQEFIYNNTDEV
jgi:hypothetical protein